MTSRSKGQAKANHVIQGSPKTRKAEQTRARIFEAARELFAERGYAATTMRDIADRADCATGLIYRYFPRREAIVIALYERVSDEFVEGIPDLPEGPLGQRFTRAIRAQLAAMEPYKDAYGGLVGAALDRESAAAVVGPASAPIRNRVERGFEMLIEGATDAPDAIPRADLARVLFITHLAVVLVWTQDTSPGSERTHRFIALLEPLIALGAPMLPALAPSLSQLSALVGEFYEG